jgi:hypothetical protein
MTNASTVASRRPARLRNPQRGGARARLLTFLVVAALCVHVAVKLIPPYIADYELQDWLDSQAPYFVVNHMADDQLKSAVMQEMTRRDIPGDAGSIKILNNNARAVDLEVDYTVPVDFGFYKTELHFSPKIDSQSLVQ